MFAVLCGQAVMIEPNKDQRCRKNRQKSNENGLFADKYGKNGRPINKLP